MEVMSRMPRLRHECYWMLSARLKMRIGSKKQSFHPTPSWRGKKMELASHGLKHVKP